MVGAGPAIEYWFVMQQAKAHSWIARYRWDVVDAMLAPFGRACVKLGQWPHQPIIEVVVAALREAGGDIQSENGTPADEVRNVYFLVRGRRIRLCIEDYGDVTLRGSRKLVQELSTTVEAKSPRRSD
jgi:hypothetical protein